MGSDDLLSRTDNAIKNRYNATLRRCERIKADTEGKKQQKKNASRLLYDYCLSRFVVTLVGFDNIKISDFFIHRLSDTIADKQRRQLADAKDSAWPGPRKRRRSSKSNPPFPLVQETGALSIFQQPGDISSSDAILTVDPCLEPFTSAEVATAIIDSGPDAKRFATIVETLEEDHCEKADPTLELEPEPKNH